MEGEKEVGSEGLGMQFLLSLSEQKAREMAKKMDGVSRSLGEVEDLPADFDFEKVKDEIGRLGEGLEKVFDSVVEISKEFGAKILDAAEKE